MKKYFTFKLILFAVGILLLSVGRISGAVTSITLNSVSSTTICSGSVITINFSSVATSNTFSYYAQLSDDLGSFTTITNLGNASFFNDQTNATFTVTIPFGTTTSSNYKIRLNSANTVTCLVCSSSSITVTINQVPAQPTSISGVTSICSGFSTTYTIAPVSGATDYSWSSSLGGTGTSTTNTITINSVTTSGPVSVTANNATCASAPQTLSVSVSDVPLQPGSISGNVTVCTGSSNTYSVTAVSGATSYNWTFPGGWTGSSTSNIISSVVPNISGDISVNAVNSCGTSSTSTLSVTVVTSTPNLPGSVSGNTNICQNSSNIYSCNTGSGATLYIWTLPIGWTGTSTTNTISATASANSGTISVTANNVCGASSPRTTSVTVNTLPVITSQPTTPAATCSGSGVQTLTVSATGANLSYSWYKGAIALSNGSVISGQGTATLTLTAPATSDAGSYYVLISGTCTPSVTSNTITITVNALPSMTSNATKTVCSGVSVALPFTASPASSFNWIATDNINTTGESLISQTSATLTNTITNTSGGVQLVNYIVTPTSTVGSCPGTPQTLTITVNPAPLMTSASTTTICSGNEVNLALIANTASTFSWLAANNPSVSGETTSATVGSIISNTLTLTVTSQQNVTYTITPTSTLGSCAGTAQTLTVTVIPSSLTQPNAIGGTNTSTICSGATATYTIAAVTNATTYTWSLPTGWTGTSSTNTISATAPSVLSDTPGTITVTANNFCTMSATRTLTVTVKAAPSSPSSISGNTTICSGTTNTYSISPLASASSYTWSIPSGLNISSGQGTTQLVTSSTATNVVTLGNISVVGNFSCGSSLPTNLSITINPTPLIQPQTTSICSGTNFIISPTNGGGNTIPSNTSYTWAIPTVTGGITGMNAQSNQSSINQTLTNPTNINQIATYTVIPTSGDLGNCIGTNFNLTATVAPKPFIQNQIATICSGGTFNITPTNGGGNIVPGGTTYTWATAPTVTGGITGGGAQPFSVFSISQTLTNTTNAPQTATYTISSSTTVCSGNTFTLTVTVYPIPTITNSSLSQAICSGGSTSAVTLTSGVVGTTFSWVASAPASLSGFIPSGTNTIPVQTITSTTTTPNAVIYSITSLANTCNSSATYTVNLNPTPVVQNQTPSICSGGIFNVNPTNGGGNIVPSGTVYSWALPTTTGGIIGSSSQTNQNSISDSLNNPSNLIQTATYIVTPSSGCNGNTFTVIVSVNPTPAIPNQTATVCSGTTFNVSPNNGGLTIIPSGTTYAWSSPIVTGGVTGGNGLTGQTSISETLTNPTDVIQIANYSVVPTSGIAGSCVGTAFDVLVTLNPKPVIPNQTASICSQSAFNVNPVSSGSVIVPVNTIYWWTAPIVTGGITGGFADTLQSSISQTLNNPTDINKTATYSIIPTSGAAGNCIGSSFNLTVTVNPTPVVPSQTRTICSLSSFTINPLNNLPTTIIPINTSYTWTTPSATGGVTGGSQQLTGVTPISQYINNPTNTTQTVTYTITPKSGAAGACVGTPFLATINVNPTPVIHDTFTVVCSNTPFSLIPIDQHPYNIVPSGTTYTWGIPTVTGGITGGSQQITGVTSISQTLTSPTTSIDTAKYLVIPTSGIAGTCPGDTFKLTVIVRPKPPMPVVANLSAVDSIIAVSSCGGSTDLSFNVTNSLSFYNYNWSGLPSSVVQLPTNNSSANTVVTFTPVVTATTVTVSVTSENNSSLGGCVSDVATFTINLSPGGGIEEQPITHMMPGNLLWYEDNTMDEYQWGYDSVTDKKPYLISGQTFQVFVPDSRFINIDTLKSDVYWFWVRVKKGNCISKVYYNGPYKTIGKFIQDEIPEVMSADIFPNPNNGLFNLQINGNIFGNIRLNIVNVLGQSVYQKNIDKQKGVEKFRLELPELEKGMYLIDLQGLYNERILSKLIIAK